MMSLYFYFSKSCKLVEIIIEILKIAVNAKREE